MDSYLFKEVTNFRPSVKYTIIFYNTKHINLGYNPDFEGMSLIHKGTLFHIYVYLNKFYILLNNVFYVEIDPIKKLVKAFGNISDSLGDSFFHQFILTPILEILYRVEGFFTLHSGGICKNEDAFLILGDSGYGKTLNTLKFVEMGYKYLGDDTIVIDENNFAYSFLKPLHISNDHLKHLKKIKVKNIIPEYGKMAIQPKELFKKNNLCNLPVKIRKIFFLRGFAETTHFSHIAKNEVFKRILAYSFIPLDKFNQNQMDIIKNLSNIGAMDVYLKKGEYLAEKI